MAKAPKRKRTHAEILFGNPEQYADYTDIADNMNKIRDYEGLSEEQVQVERREFGTLMQELGIDQADARKLHDLHTKSRLEGDSEAWQTQAAGWPAKSRRLLREQVGVDKAQVMQTKMAHLVQSKPALSKLLGKGLQHHPEVVSTLSSPVRTALGLF